MLETLLNGDILIRIRKEGDHEWYEEIMDPKNTFWGGLTKDGGLSEFDLEILAENFAEENNLKDGDVVEFGGYPAYSIRIVIEKTFCAYKRSMNND